MKGARHCGLSHSVAQCHTVSHSVTKCHREGSVACHWVWRDVQSSVPCHLRGSWAPLNGVGNCTTFTGKLYQRRMSVNCTIFCITVPSPKECCNKEECCTIPSLPQQKNTVEKILGAEKIIGKEMVESGVNRKEAVNALFTIVVAQTTLPDMPGILCPMWRPSPIYLNSFFRRFWSQMKMGSTYFLCAFSFHHKQNHTWQ